MKILITDDENPARKELAYILGQLAPEAELFEAKNGREAVEFLAKNSADVAFPLCPRTAVHSLGGGCRYGPASRAISLRYRNGNYQADGCPPIDALRSSLG